MRPRGRRTLPNEPLCASVALVTRAATRGPRHRPGNAMQHACLRLPVRALPLRRALRVRPLWGFCFGSAGDGTRAQVRHAAAARCCGQGRGACFGRATHRKRAPTLPCTEHPKTGTPPRHLSSDCEQASCGVVGHSSLGRARFGSDSASVASVGRLSPLARCCGPHSPRGLAKCLRTLVSPSALAS